MLDMFPPAGRRSGVSSLVMLAVACGTTFALPVSDARADIRIVSLKSDDPAVSIASATAGGKALKSVGKSETSLFVELGEKNRDFVCQQTLAVKLSDGRSLTRAYDICAANYTLTVETAAAVRPTPATSTASPASSRAREEQAKTGGSGRIERKLVMIQTDDDTAIREVSIEGRPAQVRRRSQARVFVEVEGNAKNDGQIDCRRAMRLVLADGRILEDEVDICGDWKVTMRTDAKAIRQAGTRDGVRQAVPSTAGPAAPPLAGGVRRPTPAPSNGDNSGGLRGSRDDTARKNSATTTGADKTETQAPGSAQLARNEQTASASANGNASSAHDSLALPLFEGREWYVMDGRGDSVSLVYGIRETDDRGFLASCSRGSNLIDATLAASNVRLAENAPVDVTLSARDVTRSFTGRGSSADNESGQSLPIVRIAADDPIWSGLARGDTLTVALNGTWRYRVSLSGSARAVRAFQQACARPAPVIADSSDLTRSLPSAEAGGPSCADEGFIASVPSDRPATIVFVNERRRPVIVHWIDFDGFRQSPTQLPPGGRMVQATLAGHPWLVSTPDGRCLGMYMPQGPTRTVTVMPGPGDRDGSVVSRPIAPPPPAAYVPGGDLVELSYDCDSGAYLNVTIDNDRQVAVVRERGLSPVTLADRSGGGVDLNYAGRGYALSGSGNRVTWERPGSPPQYCRIF